MAHGVALIHAGQLRLNKSSFPGITQGRLNLIARRVTIDARREIDKGAQLSSVQTSWSFERE